MTKIVIWVEKKFLRIRNKLFFINYFLCFYYSFICFLFLFLSIRIASEKALHRLTEPRAKTIKHGASWKGSTLKLCLYWSSIIYPVTIFWPGYMLSSPDTPFLQYYFLFWVIKKKILITCNNILIQTAAWNLKRLWDILTLKKRNILFCFKNVLS